MHWIELNRDNLLSNLLVSIIFIPIVYIFNELMNGWKKKSKNSGKSKKRSASNNKRTPPNYVPKSNWSQNNNSETIRVVVLENKETKSNSEDDWGILFLAFIILTICVKFFFTYEDTILNIIYWISLLGFIFITVILGREIKFPSTNGLKFLLGWTAFLWLCLMASIHVIYHPLYLSQQAIATQESIKNGAGVLARGFDGFFYLSYQVIGFFFSLLILLFNIGAALYTLIVWWNESTENDYTLKDKILNKILGFLDFVYNPNFKFITLSLLLLVITFAFESGFLMYFFDKNSSIKF